MNVFIILSVLVIVVGVILLVASPAALFTLNWKEKFRKRQISNVLILRYFGLYNKYYFLDYKIKIK
tara:strand:- start:34 stop:231 length:198 start_codon:yes stop_codon:yes gene_type:complete